MEQIVAEADDLPRLVADDEGVQIAVWSHDAGPGVLKLFLGLYGVVKFQVLAPNFRPFGIVTIVEKADAHDGVRWRIARCPLARVFDNITSCSEHVRVQAGVRGQLQHIHGEINGKVDGVTQLIAYGLFHHC